MTDLPAFPSIFSDNWPEYRDRGWRWHSNARNIPEQQEANKALFANLTACYGFAGVAIGHAWSRWNLSPSPIEDEYGIYINDVDAQVSDLHDTYLSSL